MIGNPNYSQWGIKSNGEDITYEIIDMVHNANSFIVIGGYNFSFARQGQMFFDELRIKANQGVPILMIFPPNLYGPSNPQPILINYCIRNGIAVMLSYQNHSKWLLTENSIYYGSSNFSPTSWQHKTEVVTLHNHSRIRYSWAKDTVQDFRLFIQREINSINRRRSMHNYTGLVANTRTTWQNIRTQILRLNPSIEKVKTTLNNYENVELELGLLTQEWFYESTLEDFSKLFEYNNQIIQSINELCRFAYSNIYNESTESQEIKNQEIIDKYNTLHSNFLETIENIESEFSEVFLDKKYINQEKELSTANSEIINKIYERIKTAPNNGYK